MTVKHLIELLEKVENKDCKVMVYDLDAFNDPVLTEANFVFQSSGKDTVISNI